MKHFIPILLCALLANGLSAAEPLYHVGIEVTSPLPKGNVPMDPTINCRSAVRHVTAASLNGYTHGRQRRIDR
jgi:hypothetical protein